MTWQQEVTETEAPVWLTAEQARAWADGYNHAVVTMKKALWAGVALVCDEVAKMDRRLSGPMQADMGQLAHRQWQTAVVVAQGLHQDFEKGR